MNQTKFRPYRDFETDKLISMYQKERSSSFLFHFIVLGSVEIALCWVYLRLAFWITISLLCLWFIREMIIISNESFDPEKLIKKELQLRQREEDEHQRFDFGS